MTKKVENKIFSFYHCRECLDEICAKQSIGDEVSPREYANYEFGATEKGFQLWCVRHEKNILALDLLGQKVTSYKKKFCGGVTCPKKKNKGGSRPHALNKKK